MPDLDAEKLQAYLKRSASLSRRSVRHTITASLIYAEKARRYDEPMASKPKKVIPLRKGAKPEKVQSPSNDVEQLRERG